MNSFCREDINLFDTANHKQNPQVMINMATMYTVKDVVEVLSNRMISRTTIVHHTCVLLAYSHVLSVLHGDYNVEGIFKGSKEPKQLSKINIFVYLLSVLSTTVPSPASISHTNCSLA